ncbi:MAG: general secretion pathway protein GspB [Methylococcaceae bacterium]|jgi:general secretion pathway protein B
MSYILDALRKSERDRKTGQVPGLPSLTSEMPRRTPSSIFWLVLLMVILNAVGLAYWLFSQGRTPSSPVVTDPAPISGTHSSVGTGATGANPSEGPVMAQNTAPSPQVIPVPVQSLRGLPPGTVPMLVQPVPQWQLPIMTRTQPPLNSGADGRLQMIPPTATDRDAMGRRSVGEGSTYPDNNHHYPLPRSEPDTDLEDAEIDESEVEESQTAMSAQASGLPVSNQGIIPHLNDLPPEVRERIPPMKISLYAYSKIPAERFVIIDTKKYRAGDRIAAALLLEIQEDNLLLELDGQKFLKSRN